MGRKEKAKKSGITLGLVTPPIHTSYMYQLSTPSLDKIAGHLSRFPQIHLCANLRNLHSLGDTVCAYVDRRVAFNVRPSECTKNKSYRARRTPIVFARYICQTGHRTHGTSLPLSFNELSLTSWSSQQPGRPLLKGSDCRPDE